ncbi:Extracellular matrix-binding ebh, putative [Babesia ovata]|uniref:Extracellular matrix-binding ebh, putative n=1 Tax=Babesia ovata TaxID=189622 RepID=A0A2H6KGC8_9APIC|nr:Extracellular matrix-binding ebh, putative [Babesia ovata]GBE62052.1 Extracellular matrix-binding ebh, putative [Babesia ovata]
MNVLTLDGFVKSDLLVLKEKISELTNGDNKVSSLVQGQLDALKQKKENELDKIAGNNGTIKKETDTGLVEKFDRLIQSPLDTKVKAVDQAIEALGGNFKNGGDLNSLQSIFDHIKGEVGKIKGKAGTGDWPIEGATGLTGIAQGLEHYFNFFRNKFGDAVGGWVDDIMRNNGLVKKLLGWQDNPAETLDDYMKNSGLGGLIRSPINLKINDAEAAFKNGNASDMADQITKVKNACQAFAEALDAELKKDPGSGVLAMAKQAKNAWTEFGDSERESKRTSLGRALAEANCGCRDCQASGGRGKDNCLKCDKKECNLTQAIATTIVTVSSVSRQVSKELHSVLLGNGTATINIAELLDKAKKATEDLQGQLDNATNQQNIGTIQESPAQAVDSKLKAVRDFVSGEQLTKTEFPKVTGDLTKAVKELPDAVKEFDEKAQAQIKAAAQKAIKEAAEVIKEVGGEIKLGKHLMEKFEESHGKIKSGLESQLQGKVNDNIGPDDPPGGQGGGVGQKFKLATGKFEHYEKHVTQPLDSSKTLTGKADANEGKLPLAIGNIRDEGLAELENTLGDQAGKINTTTFTGPFKLIEKELEEIKKLVSDAGSGSSFLGEMKNKGVKTLLSELQKGLANSKVDYVFDKGLDAIKSAISTLKTGTYDEKTKSIGDAIDLIKQQLTELREKLQKTPGNDVIKTLAEMQTKGLGTQDDWTPNGGKPLSGLGKIQQGLQEQNEKLGEHNKQIGEAIKIVRKEIELQLFRIGYRLDNKHSTDDIADHLKALQKHLGIGKANYGNNLQKIHNEIKNLHDTPFQQHPTKIDNAKKEIVDELTTLRTELLDTKDNDVIATLNDLKGVELSGDKWDKNAAGKNKSLKNIEDELGRQQKTLNDQPPQITAGVQEITSELDSLRGTLNTEVTDKLTELKSKGLTDKDWRKETSIKGHGKDQ